MEETLNELMVSQRLGQLKIASIEFKLRRLYWIALMLLIISIVILVIYHFGIIEEVQIIVVQEITEIIEPEDKLTNFIIDMIKNDANY